MGRDLLSCLEKRDLLNQSPVSVSKLMEWGKDYEEAGFPHDAADFYERAGGSEALERLLDLAVSEGDAFLFGRTLKALGREAAKEQWAAVAKRAGELGKLTLAGQARSKMGLEASSEDGQKGGAGAEV